MMAFARRMEVRIAALASPTYTNPEAGIRMTRQFLLICILHEANVARLLS
jgi:hypothetical protein